MITLKLGTTTTPEEGTVWAVVAFHSKDSRCKGHLLFSDKDEELAREAFDLATAALLFGRLLNNFDPRLN